MQLQWKGQFCFLVTLQPKKQEQVKLLIDPFAESTGAKLSPTEADVVLVSANTPEHNNLKAVKGDPFAVSSPGEYETRGVFVRGVKAEKSVVYVIEAEGARVCHLGGLSEKELSSSQVELIGDVDVLLVPVGGGESLSPEEASKVVSQIEPRLAVPMHYAQPKLKEKLQDVKAFLKSMGQSGGEPAPKLSFKLRDLTGEGTKIQLLAA